MIGRNREAEILRLFHDCARAFAAYHMRPPEKMGEPRFGSSCCIWRWIDRWALRHP
jgi:hypothetical protein